MKILVDDAQTPLMPKGDEKSQSLDSQITSTEAEASGGVLSTPAVRYLARQYGIVINDIRGTGKDGRVMKEDVLKYAASKGICKEEPFHSESSDDDNDLLRQEKGFLVDNADAISYEDKTIPLR